MAALDFPSSPTNGQVYNPGGGAPVYQWDSTLGAWNGIAAGTNTSLFTYTATGSEAGGGTIVPVTGGYTPYGGLVVRGGAVQYPDDVNMSSGTNLVFVVPLTAGESIYFQRSTSITVLNALAQSQNLADLPSPDTALTSLGLTAAGKAVARAADAAAQRTALGANANGSDILTSATTIGRTVGLAATTGQARAGINAPEKPANGSTWVSLYAAPGGGLSCPGVGSEAWAVFYMGFNGSGQLAVNLTPLVSAGGSTIVGGTPGISLTGVAWRLS
jgi:hypothetical protein